MEETMFLWVFCKNTKNNVFLKKETVSKGHDVGCPFCGTSLSIDITTNITEPTSGGAKFRFPGHKSDMNYKSPELEFRLAMQSAGTSVFEIEEKFVSVFGLLVAQKEFSKPVFKE